MHPHEASKFQPLVFLTDHVTLTQAPCKLLDVPSCLRLACLEPLSRPSLPLSTDRAPATLPLVSPLQSQQDPCGPRHLSMVYTQQTLFAHLPTSSHRNIAGLRRPPARCRQLLNAVTRSPLLPRLQSYDNMWLSCTCRSELLTAQGEGHVTWQVSLWTDLPDCGLAI